MANERGAASPTRAGKQKGANLKPRAAGADEKLITPLLVEATVLSLELTGADPIGALKDVLAPQS